MSVPTPLRRAAERIALLLVGCVLAACVLEAGIRLASLFVGERVDESDAGKERTLLTLGDSNTYGVFTTAQEAYPGQLLAELDLRAPGRYRVVNLGLPGMNSAEIVARLPGWYARYRPYAAIVCVGINNTWNESDTDWDQKARGVRHWISDLRVVRLARILRANLEPRPTLSEVTERPALKRVLIAGGTQGAEHHDTETGEVLIRHRGVAKGRRGNSEEQASRLADGVARLGTDFDRMQQISEEWDVELVLLTYAAFPLPGRENLHAASELMSEQMRDSGRRLGVPVVDVHDRFSQLLSDGGPRSRYFINETQGHANARGYTEIAGLVADHFEPR